MADAWSPRLTRGLWGIVRGAVAEGANLADVRGAVRSAGEVPDAATLSHLYARAVGGDFVARAEADYRSRVDAATYYARRPSGRLTSPYPTGFRTSARWAQVVRVTGYDPVTRAQVTRMVTISTDRLFSRGEAVDAAYMKTQTTKGALADVTVEYVQTWSAP